MIEVSCPKCKFEQLISEMELKIVDTASSMVFKPETNTFFCYCEAMCCSCGYKIADFMDEMVEIPDGASQET